MVASKQLSGDQIPLRAYPLSTSVCCVGNLQPQCANHGSHRHGQNRGYVLTGQGALWTVAGLLNTAAANSPPEIDGLSLLPNKPTNSTPPGNAESQDPGDMWVYDGPGSQGLYAISKKNTHIFIPRQPRNFD